jgi:outer membrane protein OmpA-like peptidoglycan-associated protein
MSQAIHLGLAATTLFVPSVLISVWVNAAGARLVESEAAPGTAPKVAVAASTDEGYCTADLKKILRRVLTSCGLSTDGGSGGRGCQPVEAKSVATMNGDDFNALFMPLSQRAGIIQFDKESSELDAADLAMVDKIFADRRGASYFFVVSRSSPEGSAAYNRDLSEKRGGAVLDHLKTTFQDPDLEKQVGLLWLGEEYAQLGQDFCQWQRSGEAAACEPEDLNRSAFVAWIDCRL